MDSSSPASDDMRLIHVTPPPRPLRYRRRSQSLRPGAPDRSVLLKLLHARTIAGQPGQMPPLATNVPDQQAITLFEQWIAQFPPTPEKPDPKAAGASAR